MSALIAFVQAHAVASILLGTLLIGFGGLITTLGWNAVSSAENLQTLRAEEAARIAAQRRAMLNTIAGEIVANLSVLNTQAYTETDEGALGKLVILPPLHDNAVGAAIASGLFVTDPADGELYRTILAVQFSISNLATALDLAAQDMLRVASNTNEEHERREMTKLRISLQQSPIIQTTRMQIQKLAGLIAADMK